MNKIIVGEKSHKLMCDVIAACNQEGVELILKDLKSVKDLKEILVALWYEHYRVRSLYSDKISEAADYRQRYDKAFNDLDKYRDLEAAIKVIGRIFNDELMCLE